MAPHLWRFWYQWLILAPGLGYRLHRSGRFVPKVLVGASSDKERLGRGDGPRLRRQPRRARRGAPAVQMYRVFNLREVLADHARPLLRQRLTVPTLLLFGEDDFALRPRCSPATRSHADEMQVELVPGCGHFIADERPDLVADRARAFFADN